ncbi:MAG: Dipeptide transport system permease protein DppC [Microbacteriaceae bacterium]|nr:Dipeptide transport system permease protein DppC [Microbacteriaceae bacterium]
MTVELEARKRLSPPVLSGVEEIPRGRRFQTRWLLGLPFLLLILTACFAPLITKYSPTAIVGAPRQAPGGQFIFGTDSTGMDVFSRVIAGTQIDFFIALSVVTLSAALGIVLGLLVGMTESKRSVVGIAGRGISRFIDLLEAVPAVLIVLALVAFYGTSIPTMIIIMSVLLAPIQMRLVRTEVLRIRSEAYLDAGRMAGLNEVDLVIKHVLPNALRPLFDNATVIFASAILLLSALGFLGVGLPPPTPEWGAMIAQGAPDIIVGRWWAAGTPAIAVTFSVVAAVCAAALIRRRRG